MAAKLKCTLPGICFLVVKRQDLVLHIKSFLAFSLTIRVLLELNRLLLMRCYFY